MHILTDHAVVLATIYGPLESISVQGTTVATNLCLTLTGLAAEAR